MQPLQVREDLAAQIEHGLLSHPLHVIGLQELHAEAQSEQRNIENCNLSDAYERSRTEPRVQKEMMTPRARARQVFVYGNFG